MKDTIFPKVKKRLDDVYSISPNDLYSDTLTALFKRATGGLKSFPFKFIIPFSVIASLLLYVVVGFLVVRLASILQSGF